VSGGAARRVPMLTLREFVDRYDLLAQQSGEPVALSAFGLGDEETQNLFTAFDDDYHISRFFHFSNGAGKRYVIRGEAATHLFMDLAIRALL
jgi:hypothetical protein